MLTPVEQGSVATAVGIVMVELQIILYNVIIIGFLIAGIYVYLKWQRKKRIENILDRMEASYHKYAPPNAELRLRQKQAEYDKKHPFKALKRKFMNKIKWLL